ncbi:MAG: glycosyltransferase [Sphaerochaeta associata]|uniref:glycosyltransferase n=1 Tax=Sphaerochaeta associata TaxID=1129264 RepID=UPI002B1EB1F8|nr:glycosyltransferase [Sphaerochaeta associata]MEA5108475.1 glycosyltransferase [Sphaerochaeta associata]
MSNKTIVICGNFLFPDGNAAGKRVLGLGYIFRDLGFDVAFIGMEANTTSIEIRKYSQSNIVPDDFKSYSFSQKKDIADWLKIASSYNQCIKIFNKIGINNIELIITYGSPVLSIWVSKIYKWAHNHGIKTIFDCVDWIERSNKSLIYDLIKFLDTNYQKRIAAKKADGIIVISSYLEKYYTMSKKRTVRIPPVGIQKIFPTQNRQGIKLVYAGSPFSIGGRQSPQHFKDRLDLIIDLVDSLDIPGEAICLKIIGLTQDEYLKVVPRHRNCLGASDKIKFLGKMNNIEVIQEISNANFSILIRDSKRVTNAGFPTKVSESLLFGIPVITNLTSDIADYITDGGNGIIIPHDISLAKKKLTKIFSNRNSNTNTYGKSECPFDYSLYLNKMETFLSTL